MNTLTPQPPTPVIDTEAVITRLLDNNLHRLEALRLSLELSDSKGRFDVRPLDTAGVLQGVEQSVSYPDLLLIIDTVKDGLARRRLSLQPSTL